MIRKSYNRKYEEYVCVDAVGNLLKPQYVTEHFKIILKKHGLDKIRFHDLRHSCASLMLYNKEGMKRIQAWLGHSTIAITADTYSHLEFQSKVDSSDLISDSLLIKKRAEVVASARMAEGVGFEPTWGCPQTVFKIFATFRFYRFFKEYS